MSLLSDIQSKIKAPKNQYNAFGRYKYRSLEDIFEGLKPIIKEFGCSVTLSDEMVLVGDRYYIKATALLYDKDNSVVAQNTAYAREPLAKKGMDEAQITGATSSYARKYALNGLFAIDDLKDADAKDNKNQTPNKPETLASYLKKKGVKNSKGFAVQYGVKSTEDAQKLLHDKGALDSLIEEFKSLNALQLP